MKSLTDILSIRQQITKILKEPTIDKVWSTLATWCAAMFCLQLAVYLLGLTNEPFELVVIILIVIAASGIVFTLLAVATKRLDQQARTDMSQRELKEMNQIHLLENPKLKETEIYLNDIEEIKQGLHAFATILKALVEKNHKRNHKEDPVDTDTTYNVSDYTTSTDRIAAIQEELKKLESDE